MLAESNSFVNDYLGYVLEFNQNFEKLIMNTKRLPLSIKDKDSKDFDDEKDYPTLADLMREQNISSDQLNTVHRREI